MTIKSILVHVEDEKNCQAKLESAFLLAKHFNALLTAIFVNPVSDENITPTLTCIPEGANSAVPQEINHYIKTVRKRKFAKIADKIRCIALSRDCQFKLESVSGEVKHVLTETSRCYDLLIVSSNLRSDVGISKIGLPTNSIAIECGCPVLVIPSQSQQAHQFKHPLIAWNSTPESARAVSDSIPILAKANDVSFVNTETKQFSSREYYRQDLIDYLQLHHVDAKFVKLKKSSEQELNIRVNQVIAEKKNDLLVLGAYGHSQLRELFFSSQTKELLNAVVVPVLLSH